MSAEKCLIKRQADFAFRYKEDTIMTLEATIENKNYEIEILRAKSKFKADDIDEIDSDSDSPKASTSSKSVSCDTCTSTVPSSQDFEEHVENEYNCEICSFKTKKVDILSKHRYVEHSLKCYHCNFVAQSKETFDSHMEEFHRYKCNKCNLAHNDEYKHHIHICREDINNPTFRSMYTKAWLDQNGCNAIYCSERNEDIIWLHSNNCWTGDHPCSWIPHVYFDKPIEPGAVMHLKYSDFVKDNIISWSALCVELKI